MALEQLPADHKPQAAAREIPPGVQILLKSVSHPELGDIAIEDDLFPIGRTEAPFAAYPPGAVDALSRRHARIFCERGYAYVADLDSKNGTTVNRVPVRETPSRLKEGDEICFGGELAYRVHLAPRREKPPADAKVLGVTLAPERSDLGLEPIAITRFPFLISKVDENFCRYRDQYPHQVNYLSRRHAHIFLKGGQPWLEDLGSTNGTFVAGNRLDEHAVPLQEGDLVAFGGQHFVYRVGLVQERALDPTVTRIAALGGNGESVDTEKTTFVAAADSFLDIFCVEQPAPAEGQEGDGGGSLPEEGGRKTVRKGRRISIFLAELGRAFAGSGEGGLKRHAWWGAGALGLLLVLAVAIGFRDAPEREVKRLMAGGEHARAAAAADRFLLRHPNHGEMRALGTEAVLKAHVPIWISQIRARDFDGAAATLAGMKPYAIHNPDVDLLLGELEWLGDLEGFYLGRGGAEAPIRIFADEDRIRKLLAPWEQDPQGHQRAFDRIASLVPEFGDFHGEALSHLRKIQSDDSLYGAAIQRLKAALEAELKGDSPEGLEASLKEYGEKYPRLGGLDALHKDLLRYREIQAEILARRPGRVAFLLAEAGFSTPPFQARVEELAASGQLPPADVLQQFAAVSAAWREGRVDAALATLQQLGGGPWAGPAGQEAARRKLLVEQFAALRNARGSKDYDERLLAFCGNLEADEDIHFVRAVAGDLEARRDKVLQHAQEAMGRARAQWAKYRETGPIGAELRAEAATSPRFAALARALAEAWANIRRAERLYRLLQADLPGPWANLREETRSELEQQRRALLALRESLEPAVLQSKLALLGEGGGG